MRKHFKTKKRFRVRNLFWFNFFIIVIGINILNIENISYANIILKQKDIIKFIYDKEKLLLKLGLNYEEKQVEEDLEVFHEIIEEQSKIAHIYLYNTHQTEEYADTNIYDMTKLFKEKLSSVNINAIVENTNIANKLKEKNLQYKDSYKITRDLINSVLDDEYDLYIDIHRDSTKKKNSTTSINDKKYARVMFVIGGNHDDYQSNYTLAESLNKLLKNNNSNLSRGIYVRKSSAYNQDLDPNVLLIEIGGPENTREEVSNTLDILVKVFKDYFNE